MRLSITILPDLKASLAETANSEASRRLELPLIQIVARGRGQNTETFGVMFILLKLVLVFNILLWWTGMQLLWAHCGISFPTWSSLELLGLQCPKFAASSTAVLSGNSGNWGSNKSREQQKVTPNSIGFAPSPSFLPEKQC